MERKKSKEKEEKNNNSSNNNGKNNESSENGENSEQSEFGDDHSMWEKAFEKYKKQSQSSKDANDKKDNDTSNQNGEKSNDEKEEEDGTQNGESNDSLEIDENSEFEKNRQEKIKKFQENKKKIQGKFKDKKSNFSDVGIAKEEIEWQRILEKKLKKTEINWSKRRSIRENNYAYRLEETEEEDEILTEVILDVSGSVDTNLLRAFLRQLKPLLRESKLKVGLFNMEFYPFKEIKSVKDIDEFSVPYEVYLTDGTNLDLPVRSFSKDPDKKINKIIFTDGYGYMPLPDLANEDVIWLIYDNESFKPCCGKVITISDKQIEQMKRTYVVGIKNMKKNEEPTL